MAEELDVVALRAWEGQQESTQDSIALVHVREIAATLNWNAPFDNGSALPHLWHWAFFRPSVNTVDLDKDGHPNRGGFLPPVPLPRRMWAGGRLLFHKPLTVGKLVQRTSTIAKVNAKSGRSGKLVFVTILHHYVCGGALCVSEEQDIVYREAAPRAHASPSSCGGTDNGLAAIEWVDTRVINPALLFRYSAVTFNTHRIHYDREYAINDEGYSGLVVHGPLAATLMLDSFVEREGARLVKSFAFKGVRPLIAQDFLTISCASDRAEAVRLWVADEGGHTTMEGTIALR